MGEIQIAQDKIRAYLATSYRLGFAEDDIVLTIGTHSAPLAALFREYGVECGAFLTAYNPRGEQQTDLQNELAHGRLVADLTRLGLGAIAGSGSEEGTGWPAERSCFALGLSLEGAKIIGTKFDQDAIVWIDGDAVPQLILLR